MSALVVIGSTNIDLVMQVEKIPSPGETLGGGRFSQHMGGKGANQAYAASLAGAPTTFISCLGNDEFGTQAKNYFDHAGINTEQLRLIENERTGTALIFVAASGENCIGVSAGANGSLDEDVLNDSASLLASADFILLQNEIPISSVESIFKRKLDGDISGHIIYNPAPALAIASSSLAAIDTIILNETEAAFYSGVESDPNNPLTLIEQANTLTNNGMKQVVLTLGAKGVFFKSDREQGFIRAKEAKAVDTTAAGDVFCGAFAAGLTQEKSFKEALEYANVAAGISVTRLGAQQSAPSKAEIENC